MSEQKSRSLAARSLAATPRVTRRSYSDEDARRVASRLLLVSPSESAATVAPPTATSLATLLSRHVLRDGELVILLLKPSVWFILLSSLRFIAIVVIILSAIFVFDLDDRIHANKLAIIEAGVFIAAGRLMWAVLQW